MPLPIRERKRIKLVSLARAIASTVAESSPPLNNTTALLALWVSIASLQVPALADIHRRRKRIALVDRCLNALLQHALRFENEFDRIARRAFAALVAALHNAPRPSLVARALAMATAKPHFRITGRSITSSPT